MPIPTGIPEGGIIKVRAVCKQNPQYGINVGYYRCNYVGAGGGLSTADVATSFEGTFSAQYLLWQSNVTQWWGLGVTLLGAVATPEAVVTTNRGFGTTGTKTCPSQAAGLFTLRTAFAGRSYRGRKYIPFVSNDLVQDDNSTLAAGGLTLLGTIADLWALQQVVVVGLTTLNLNPVIQHRDPMIVPTSITDRTLRANLATQRRRSEVNKADNDPFAAAA